MGWVGFAALGPPGAERVSYDDRRAEATEGREGKPQHQGHH